MTERILERAGTITSWQGDSGAAVLEPPATGRPDALSVAAPAPRKTGPLAPLAGDDDDEEDFLVDDDEEDDGDVYDDEDEFEDEDYIEDDEEDDDDFADDGEEDDEDL